MVMYYKDIVHFDMRYQHNKFLETMKDIRQLALADVSSLYAEDEDEEKPIRPKTWPPMNVIERLEAWQCQYLKLFAVYLDKKKKKTSKKKR